MQLFISAFFGFILVFPVFLISAAISKTPSVRERNNKKALEKAKERGHVVEATLVRQYRANSDIGARSDYQSVGQYQYSYKGKQYTYRFQSDDPPYKLTLYFVKKPRKATVEGALREKKNIWPLIYIAVTALLYVIIKAMN